MQAWLFGEINLSYQGGRQIRQCLLALFLLLAPLLLALPKVRMVQVVPVLLDLPGFPFHLVSLGLPVHHSYQVAQALLTKYTRKIRYSNLYLRTNVLHGLVMWCSS